jgi:hypothetical protein
MRRNETLEAYKRMARYYRALIIITLKFREHSKKERWQLGNCNLGKATA